MRIYVARTVEARDARFREFVPEDPRDFQAFCDALSAVRFTGQDPATLMAARRGFSGVIGGKKKWPVADIYQFPVTPQLILGERAFGLLEPLLSNYGAFLPLSVAGDVRFRFFQRTAPMVDALDLDSAMMTPSRSAIKIHSFREELLVGLDIFQIPQSNEYFLSERFKQVVVEHGLFGLEFRLVWDSEDPDFLDERYEPEPWRQMVQEFRASRERLMEREKGADGEATGT